MKYKFLLFDVDRTLLDFDKSEENALRKTLKQHKIKLSTRMTQYYRNINEALWKNFEQGHITKKEIINIRFKNFFELFNINLDPTKFNDEYLLNLKNTNYKILNATKILKKLSKDFEIYVVTNGIKEIQENRLKLSGLNQFIKKTFISEEIGSQKPKYSFYKYVFNNIENFEKEKAITIGDSLSSDILGGNNAGIKTIWFNSAKEKTNPNIIPDFEIYKLKQLYKILY
ncbi:MAG: YjjG family noncanonical pyrimidine nucleotidase [Bacilli bacterium]